MMLGQPRMFFVAVFGSCGILVVIRVSEPVRAELVLRWRTDVYGMGLFYAGHGAVFDGPSGGVEYQRISEYVFPD